MAIVARSELNPEQKTADDPVLAALKQFVADIQDGLIGVQLDVHADNWQERLKTFAMPVARRSVLVRSAISVRSWNCSYDHASGIQIES